MSNKNFVAYGDAETILTEYAEAIDKKESIFRFSTMPTASSTNVGQIIQYIGTTDANYTNGYFYKCVAQGTDPETYEWEEIDVQSGGSGDSRIGKGIKELNVKLEEDGTIRPYIVTSYKNILPSFIDASINQIKQIADMYYDGTLSLEDIQDAWKVGDSTTVTLNNMTSGGFVASQAGGDYQFVILDFNHDTLTTAYKGNTKSLLTIGLKTHLPTITGISHKRGDSGSCTGTGWNISEMRTFCNEVVINALPSDLKSMVKSVTKTTYAYPSGIQTTQDKIFIPTQKEFADTGSDGTVYEYYKTTENRNHGATVWTSSGKNDGEHWMALNTNGTLNSSLFGFNASAYMMFAFCI